jgi:YYY domain-containing protein
VHIANTYYGKRTVLDYLHIIFWFIIIEFLGLISIPMAGMLADGLADRGYSAARTLGIMLVTYMSWILSYLLGFNIVTVSISVLTLCLLSFFVYRKQRYFPDKKILLSNELIFAAAFLFFLIVRLYIPQIYMHEKFMDFAFLNAMIRTASFPPADPWFAGESLDFYYYLGYLTVGVPGKLCSVEPSILFNLAISLIFALCFNLFFGIGYNLTSGKIKYGLLTSISVILLGNIQGFIEFIKMYVNKEPSSMAVSVMGYYWSSSRVIPFTINEFPYFTFILGDLHSHMLAIPFYILVLTFLLSLYFRKEANRIFENNLALLIFSLALGFLFPANSWDFPVYFSLTFVIVLVHYYGYYNLNKDLFGSVSGFLKTVIFISTFSFLPYLPFYLSFDPKAAGGFDFVGPELRTSLDKFLILFGLFLFLIFSFLICRLESRKKLAYFIMWIGISSILSLKLSIPLLVILFPLIVLSLFLFLKDLPDRSPAGFISLLVAIASFIALLCELVRLNDHIIGSFARMNTVFKFYMHLWIFLAVAASYSYYELKSHIKNRPVDGQSLKKVYGKKVWNVSLLFLIVSCSFFPMVSTFTRIKDMNATPSLDGMEYIRGFDEGDYNALKWMQKSIEGTQIVLEASTINSSYTYISRVSTNTGLPTIIGWTGHELFWRQDPKEITQRVADVNYIYNTDNKKKALELIDKYNVSYVYIGQLERQLYKVRIEKFEDKTYFEPVYFGPVTIYKVKKQKNISEAGNSIRNNS